MQEQYIICRFCMDILKAGCQTKKNVYYDFRVHLFKDTTISVPKQNDAKKENQLFNILYGRKRPPTNYTPIMFNL